MDISNLVMTISKRSEKRRKQERLYAKVRKVYMLTHPRCEVFGCESPATTLHHKKGRLGELLTDDRFFLAVCMPHHLYIENHPIEAKEKGYSLSRLANG